MRAKEVIVIVCKFAGMTNKRLVIRGALSRLAGVFILYVLPLPLALHYLAVGLGTTIKVRPNVAKLGY